MSLVNCVECNKLISDKAHSCPQCGHPMSGAASASSASATSSSSGSDSGDGCGTIIGGAAMIGIGGLIVFVAIKVFNFIIGAVGGVLAFIGLALMGFAS